MTQQELENLNLEILNYKHLSIFERIFKITNILDNGLDDDLKKLTNLRNYRNELAFITKYCNYDQYIKVESDNDRLKMDMFIKRYNIPVQFDTNDKISHAFFEVEIPLIIFKSKIGRSVINLDEMVNSLNLLGEKHFDLNIALRKNKISNVLNDEYNA